MIEITSASLVREFLVESGVDVGPMYTEDGGLFGSITRHTGFHATLPCGSLVTIIDQAIAQISIGLSVAYKAKIGRINRISGSLRQSHSYWKYKRSGPGWLHKGDVVVFNLNIPGSLDHILDFLTPKAIKHA